MPRFAVGVKASSLGAGIEVGTAITRKSNVRVGFNDFSYSDDFNKDGINYGGKLQLRSVEVLYDQYLIGGFHISPGALIYNANRGTATASVSGGQSFTLNDVTYFSDRNNPVTGSGTLNLGKAAPMVLLGFGNLLPRTRHFAVNFEFGAVFQGSPETTLNLAGNTCSAPTGGICQNIGTNSSIQANIKSEQDKINKDLKPFKYYPVISLGFGYKF